MKDSISGDIDALPLRKAVARRSSRDFGRARGVTLVLFLLIAGIIGSESSAVAETYTFNKVSAPWNSSSSWLPDDGVNYPGSRAGDIAIINAGTVDVTDKIPNPLSGLTLGTTAPPVAPLPAINISITATDALIIGDGIFSFNSGSLEGLGSVVIAAPATLNLTTGPAFLGTTIRSSGTINYGPQGVNNLLMTQFSVIENDGIINLINDAPITSANAGTPGLIHNGATGTIRKSGGVPTIAFQSISPEVANDGVLKVDVGFLSINGSSTVTRDSGQFIASPDATLQFGLGNHLLTSPTLAPSITGGGTVQIGSNASVTINSPSGDSGQAFLDINRITVAGTLVSNNLTVPSKANLLDLFGTLTGRGDFLLQQGGSWTGGQISGNNTNQFIVAPTASLFITAVTSTAFLRNITLLNQGFVGLGTGFFIAGGNAIMRNAIGAHWFLNADGPPFDPPAPPIVTAPDGPPEFFNEGSLAKTLTSTPPGSTNLPFHVTNSGTIESDAGTINFLEGMTQTAGTTFLTNHTAAVPPIAAPRNGAAGIRLDGGTLVGGGIVDANLTNNGGTVFPGFLGVIDTIAVTGNYIQGPGGTLIIKLAAGSTDHLNISGTSALSGTLNLQSLNGFTPPQGSSFPIVNYLSDTGAFTTVNSIGLNTGFSLTYGASQVIAMPGVSTLPTVPAVSINNVSASEGDSGTTPFTFTVSLSVASTVPVTVGYATANGTAVAGSDYVATSGSITFAPGVTSQTIQVLVSGDSVGEPDETFTVNLSNPTNATIASATGTGTIVNDDAFAGGPTISIADGSRLEGDSGTTFILLNVTLSAPSPQTVTVSYATANGTATAGSDYVAATGTLTFPPGLTSQSLTVVVSGDTDPEPDETFTVTLFAPSNATLGKSTATGTILNDDGPIPAISISDVSRTEGNSETTPFLFSVTLSVPGTRPISVNYATANGTATAGSDYVAATGTLVFPPGVLSQTLAILVNGDTMVEPDETFTVALSAPTNAILAIPTATGTIVNDDGIPSPCSAVPTNLFPLDDAQSVATSGVLEWAPTAGASSYNIYFGPNSGCSTLAGNTTSASFPYSNLAALTTYQWRVEAISSTCPPAPSACQSFTTGVSGGPSCSAAKPEPLTPADGATNLNSPIAFTWTAVSGAVGYQLFTSANGGTSALAGATTTATTLTAAVANGTIKWFVQALFAGGCPPTISSSRNFSTCNAPPPPVITANVEATSGQVYFISWNPTVLLSPGAASQYVLEESPTADFTGPLVRSFNVSGTTSPAFQHDVTTGTPFYYRVRGVSDCGASGDVAHNVLTGDFSAPVRVVVLQLPAANQINSELTAPLGSTRTIIQTLLVPGVPGTTLNFSSSTDEPWLSVAPPSGILPPEGVTLAVIADPANLRNGTVTGTVIVTTTNTSSGKSPIQAAASAPIINVPISLNIVTPVTAVSKIAADANALVIPAVGHVSGADSKWQSDVRVTNTGLVSQTYRLTFTPSGTDSRLSSEATLVTADAGMTIALNDIVKNWFGFGSLSDGASGVLEIRPVAADSGVTGRTSTEAVATTSTLASSRTYNTTLSGTLGQFIPAIPLSSFIGGDNAVLSLQQIVQSSAYRTNFGLVEGAGHAVSVLATIFDGDGKSLASQRIDLKAGEQRQLDNFLGAANITNLNDGRIEVKVLPSSPQPIPPSPGIVTSYASVVDNKTNDPLLITGQVVGQTSAHHFVVPGVADLNTGFASWRTDMRIFNSGAPVEVTLTFYPQDSADTPSSKKVTINRNETRSLDNVLQSQFGITNAGGALHVTTVVDAPLIVSARTYNQTENGTFGQFVPAVTAADAVGVGERSLNILQVEDSDRFRTNLGLAEVTGQPATVEVSVVFADDRSTPTITFQLPANGFLQTRLLNTAGLSHAQAYNARFVVRVTAGAGKVTAYGSVIDSKTEDPTYVPAQ